jgi:hypothetical protein
MEAPRQRAKNISGYFLAAPSEHKIPTILKVVSYSFFLPAIPSCFHLVFLGWLIFVGGFPSEGSKYLLIALSFLLAQIIFWFLLSRGLRRCSRGWRMCALVVIWLSFGLIGIDIIRLISVKKFPHGETFWEPWIGVVLGCGVLAWQYWVLTRPDIRKLFFPERQG